MNKKENITCPTCKKTRYVMRNSRSPVNYDCKKCYIEKRSVSKTRVCKRCGDVKVVNTAREARLQHCRKCSTVLNGEKRRGKSTKPKHLRVRYWYFCTNCSSINESRAKNRTIHCSDCSRRLRNKQKYIYFNIHTMQYVMQSEKVVEQKNKKVLKPVANDCKKIQHKKTSKKKKVILEHVKKKPLKKKRYKGISKAEINRRKEINRLHRESCLAKERQELVVVSKRSDEELIDKWLKSNRVKVINATTKDTTREVRINGY